MEVIIGKNYGFCFGVKRAVDGAFKQLENEKKLYCLGELVHNKQVMNKLQENGAILIDDLEQVKNKNLKVIIRAHGIPKKVYETAKDMGIELIDFTCPSVLKVQNIAEEYSNRGFFIILTCSKKNHPEVLGIESHCGDKYVLIENIHEVDSALKKFKEINNNKLLLISQTTYSMKKFKDVELMIKESLDRSLEFVVSNTICLATQIRQDETKKLASEVDKMIIIGGKNSSNTQKLFEIALKNCNNSICVETKEEIENEDFSHCNKIGIMAGASTPQWSIDEIKETIRAMVK